MALKPDRIELGNGSRIKYFMNAVAERGIVVVFGSTSGEGMDDPDSVVAIPTAHTAASGTAAGVLMNDVVNLDLTRQHINWHQDEVQVGNKVDVLRQGFIRTNMLKSGDTPTAGDAAHFAVNGEFTTTTTSDQVGVFVSQADAEGYVEIEINMYL